MINLQGTDELVQKDLKTRAGPPARSPASWEFASVETGVSTDRSLEYGSSQTLANLKIIKTNKQDGDAFGNTISNKVASIVSAGGPSQALTGWSWWSELNYVATGATQALPASGDARTVPCKHLINRSV